MKVSKEEEKEILNAIDVVCINCVEDTLNNENICENCPVRKLSESMECIEQIKSNNIKKGDRVKVIGNFPKEIFATVIRKGHKNHWVINIDGETKNVEWNERNLEIVKEK